MSYLICEECGKYYELDEGKSSFSYEKCQCGGKLTYTDKLNGKSSNVPFQNSKITCSSCGVKNPEGSNVCYSCGNLLGAETRKNKKNLGKGISWMGIAIGFGFLMISTLLSVLAIFGTNFPIPQKPEDIPYNLLMAFGIIAMIIAVISGLISSYIGGSIKFKNGMLNGGLVGVILGVVVGITGGSIAFLGVILVFGSLSVLGGIFGTYLKRRL